MKTGWFQDMLGPSRKIYLHAFPMFGPKHDFNKAECWCTPDVHEQEVAFFVFHKVLN